MLTIAVQSSSIITSTFTPLVALDIMTVEEMSRGARVHSRPRSLDPGDRCAPPARAAGFSRRVGGTGAIGTVEIGSYGARVPLGGI